MAQALDFSLKRPLCGSDGASSSDICSSPESSPKRIRHDSNEHKLFSSASSPQAISSTTRSPGLAQSQMGPNLQEYLGMNGALAALLASSSQSGIAQRPFSMYNSLDAINNAWMTGSPSTQVGSTSLLGLSTMPDASMFPSAASLALSTLQRRRKTSACRALTPPMKLESPSQSDNGMESPLHKSNGAKVGSAVPEEKKDSSYWERRRKNNEAAKRSRDTRRAKEEEIAMRASFLEQDNLKLRAQVTILKNETAKLQFMLFSQVQMPNNVSQKDTSS